MTLSPGPHTISALDEAGLHLLYRRKVVLVVDLVESVSLMQSDELGVIKGWQAFVAHVNQFVLPARKGRMVKSLGDGLMIEFDAPRDAAAAAFVMHEWMEAHCVTDPGALQMHLRIGMHASM